jgi:hypothetical protein
MKKKCAWNYLGMIVGLLVITIGFTIPSHFTHALSISPIRYEVSGDPGQVLEENLSLRNETTAPETYYPEYYNFEAQGETGVPQFVHPKDGLGTWMAAPAGVTLAPGDSQTVVFVISIPKDAVPGGYFGAILYGTTPPSLRGTSGLAVSTETGPLVLLRVNGDIKESASLSEFKVKNDQHFFTALPVEMYYRFQNTGGDRTEPTGTLVMKNVLGIKVKTEDANPVQGNVLPGQIRRIDLAWQKSDAPGDYAYASRGFFSQIGYEWKNFAFGYFTAHLNLSYGTNSAQSANAKVSFFVFPWQLLIVLILGVFILWYLLKFIFRKYNNWIIKQAEIAIERSRANNLEGPKEDDKSLKPRI